MKKYMLTLIILSNTLLLVSCAGGSRSKPVFATKDDINRVSREVRELKKKLDCIEFVPFGDTVLVHKDLTKPGCDH